MMWREFLSLYREYFSEGRALHQAVETCRLDRYFTFPNFEKTAERCADEMVSSGLSNVEVESFPADGKTLWSGWGAMKAWNVDAARLWMVSPTQELLCDWTEVPQSLVMYSGEADVEGEIVEWDGEDIDLEGKIPLTRRRINDVFPAMRARNVRGILSDFLGTLPGVRDPLDLPDSCRWENSAIRLGYGNFWGFMLTPRQGQKMRDLLRSGPVRVRAQVKAGCYEGIFKSATGVIQGSERPEEEVLFVSHLYEPGGNDNASGVGCGLEVARSLQAAIEAGAVPRPRRSLRFLFNWEGYGLLAWMEKHRDRVAAMLGGLNIDEIGVDQHEGRSVLHLFMPPAANPSCVGPLTEYLCQQIIAPEIRYRVVADRAEIINDTVTSDPNLDVPLPCLIQYPSRHYHASSDVPATLSPFVLRKIGLLTATQLYTLANSGTQEATWIAKLTHGYTLRELIDTDLKFHTGDWPFSVERTVEYFRERVRMAQESVLRYGLTEAQAKENVLTFHNTLEEMSVRWREQHPDKVEERREGTSEEERARGLILGRKTLGAPKAWGSFDLSPTEEAEYRKVLYDNNLDLLFHRICYWADGKRNLLEIADRLEIEMESLTSDLSISRTSSDMAFDPGSATRVNLRALLYVVDRLIREGYLEARGEGRAEAQNGVGDLR